MTAALRPAQILQLQSFWNLIQTTDEGVQKGLYLLMQRKYATVETSNAEPPSFLNMQGILKGKGNAETDRQLLDDYLQEKYSL